MPTYEFRCKSCGTSVMERHPLADIPDAVECVCGSEAGRRVSSFGVQLRGRGWASHPDRESANRKKGPQ